MKKFLKVFGVLAALGMMVSFAGCSSTLEGQRLSEAIAKSTEVQSLTNYSKTSVKVNLTGVDVPEQTQQVLSMLNNASITATLKSDVKNNKTTAEGSVNLLGVKVADAGMYVDNNKVWLKLPDNAKYIDLMATANANSVISEAQMLQLQQKSKDLAIKFLKDYFNEYNYAFLDLKSLGTKVVNTPEGNKNVSLIEVKIDNSEFPKLIDYTIKNASTGSAVKEYLKAVVSMASTIDPSQEISITDIQKEIDKSFEEFSNNADSNSKMVISELSKYIELGKGGIDITYGIDEQNNIVSGESKYDIIIKNPEDIKQKVEIELNTSSVNYDLNKTVVDLPKINKNNTITFEDYAKANPILKSFADSLGGSMMQDSDNTNKISLKIGENMAVVGANAVEMDAVPYIEGEYTMVPVKFIGDALGASVEWNGDTRQVSYNDGEHSVLMEVGNRIAFVDGMPIEMPVAPIIKNERTMIPLRFVSEQMGARVDWNNELQIISIYK